MKVKDIIAERSTWLPGKGYEASSPVVSVMLPTYRRNKNGMFRAAVESVLNQTFRDIELIIIDDCSYDGTFDAIQEMMAIDDRISCIRHEENIGIVSISLYEAYLRAKGTYISFMFDDNEWEPDALENTMAIIEGTGCRATYGVTRFIVDGSGKSKLLGEHGVDVALLEASNFIGNGSVVIEKALFEEIGWYDPHLVLTRLTDWDLWRRLSKYTEFLSTGIAFTTEKGMTQADSLGNSYPMNSWASREYMLKPRNEELKPSEYGEFDIIGTCESDSSYFIEYMKTCMQQFEGKTWFDTSDESYRKLADGRIIGTEKKKVMVCTTKPIASELLHFGRMGFNDDCCIAFYCLARFNYQHMAQADILVVSRTLNVYVQAVLVARQLGIPCYYYIDDNFIELKKQGFRAEYATKTAELTCQDYLSNFQGIIVSTDALKEYFLENGLHDNVIVFRPIYDVRHEYTHSSNKSISIAFIGGHQREEALFKYVIPAIKNIQGSRTVEFYMPDDCHAESHEDEHFHVHRIKRENYVDNVIKGFGEHSIDIQVHPGNPSLNNAFKTKNAMLTAAQLGAVLVASDDFPYTSDDVLSDCYLCADSSIDAWSAALAKAFDDKARQAILERARSVCRSDYSLARASEEFIADVKASKRIETPYRLQRTEQHNLERIGAAETEMKLSDASQVLLKEEAHDFIAWVSKGLVSGLGFVFAGTSKEPNRIDVTLKTGNAVVASAMTTFANIAYRSWTYFDFGPIPFEMDTMITVSIAVEYSYGGPPIAIYVKKHGDESARSDSACELLANPAYANEEPLE